MQNTYAIKPGSPPPAATATNRAWVLSLWLLLYLMASSFAVLGQNEPIPGLYGEQGLPMPTVTSDKDDYVPGEVAIITGKGWTLDQYVDIHLAEEPAYDHHHEYHDTKVNADGTWEIKYQIEERHLGVKFTVVVDGMQSGAKAYTYFTDGLYTFDASTNTFTITAGTTPDGSGSTVLRWSQLSKNGTYTTSTNPPDVNSTIIIKNGAILTVDAINGVCKSIQLGVNGGSGNGNGSLVFNTNSQVTVSEGVTLGDQSRSGQINMTAGGKLICSNLTFAAGSANNTITQGTGSEITVNGTVNLDQPTDNDRTNTWNINSGSATVSGLISFPGTNTTISRVARLSITSGTLNANGGISFTSSVPATKVIDMSGGNGILNLKGVLTIPSNSSTLTAGNSGSIFNFLGDNNNNVFQSIRFFSAGAYHNLHINAGTGNVQLINSITATNVTGNVRVQNGRLHAGSISGNSNRTFEVANSATFLTSASGVNAFPSGFGTVSLGPTSSVYYNATDAQTIAAHNYGHLFITSARTTNNVTFANTGIIGVSGMFNPEATFTSGTYITSGSTISFKGLSNQNIPAFTFNNLEVDNNAGVTLIGNVNVNGATNALKLINGIITTGANTLTLAAGTTISGASEMRYVNGKLAQVYSGVGSKIFPVGKREGSINIYRPLTLNYTALSGTSTVTVEQFEDDFEGTFTTGHAQLGSRFWRVTEMGSTSRTYNITLDGTGFTPTNEVKILKYNATPTVTNDLYATTGTAPNYTASGLTSFSDFALGQVTTIATTTTLVSSLNPSVYGQSVSFTATVAPTSGSSTPTGDVVFKNGAETLGTVALATIDGAQRATFTTSSLAVNTSGYSITAEYAGAGTFTASTSTAVSQVVNKASTSTAIVTSKTPSVFGEEVTFTATVTATAPGAGTPAGNVVFKNGTTVLGTVPLSTVSGAQKASLSTSSLVVNTSGHSITAEYAGSDDFNSSASSAVSQVVNKATATVDFVATTLSQTYTGSPLSVSATTNATGTSSFTITYDGSETAPTNYKDGGYAVVATLVNDNFTGSATGTFIINKAPLTASLTGVVSKEYNGNAIATLVAANYELSGVVSGDAVALNNPVSGTYNDKTVNTGKAVTVTGLAISGADASNYTVNATATANIGSITAKALTASLKGVVSKEYDGNANAALVAANYELAGVISGDEVSLNNPAEGLYDTKDKGTGKTVTVSGLELSGDDASNYTVNPTASAAIGSITAKALTASLKGVVSKEYDGNANAALVAANYELAGVISGDEVSLNNPAEGLYDTKDKGTGKTVTVSGLELSGDDASNYTVNTSATANIGTITAKALTASLKGVVSKEYNGNANATLTAANYELAGVVSGDEVSLNNPTSGSYNDKTVNTNKAVTVTGLAISGADASNYTVNASASANIGTITVKPLTASLTGSVSKEYDGNRDAALAAANYELNGIISGDAVTLNNPAEGLYDTKDKGTGKTVTVSGLSISGADAANYSLPVTTASAAIGAITAKGLTASLTGVVSKEYNGNANATLAAANYELSGVVSGDAVALNNPVSGTYNDKTVNTGKAVTVTGLAISGADASNYTVNATATANIGTITAKALTVSLKGIVSKEYDGNRDAALVAANYELAGVISGDEVSLNNPAEGLYDTKDKGTGKTVTVSGLELSGDDATNYTVNATASAAIGSISAKGLTASLKGVVSKEYDGNANAALVAANYELAGVVSGNAVALNNPASGLYDTKDKGTGKTVTVTGLAISGDDASNYTVNTSATANIGTITAKALTASLKGVVSKEYNGNANATLAAANYELSGVVSGDAVALNNPVSGTYNDKTVNTNKAVTVSGLAISGDDASNYTVNTSATANIGTITAKALTASLKGVVSKEYNGNANATLVAANYELSGVVSGDAVALNNPVSGTYNDKTVNTGKAVTVTGLAISGADASNYTVNATATANIGTITAKALTVSLKGIVSKEYDGNRDAALVAANYELAGVISGDEVSLNNPAEGLYDTKDKGTGKTVTVTGLAISGDDASNYTVNATATANIGTITAKGLTVTATGISKVYDGTTSATVTLSSNKLGSDIVTLAYTSATFADANVNENISVSVAGISISGADAGNYSLVNTTAITTAQITKAGTTLTLTTSAGQVRFMDNLTMTATIKPDFKGNPLTGKVIFYINGKDYSNDGVSVVAVPGASDGSVQATLIKQVAEVPGSYTVYAKFISSNNNYSSDERNAYLANSKSLIVVARNATPQNVNAGFYTGDVFAWTTSSTSSKATVTLIASLKDNNTPSGDLRAAKVTFYYVNGTTLTPIPSAKDLPVGLVDVNDGSVGFATATVQFDIGSNNAQEFLVAVGVSGAYTNNPSNSLSQATVTVSKPVPGGFIVGGSQITNVQSNGYVRGHTGYNTDYQFDITYTKSGSNPKGKAKVMVRSFYKPDGTLDNKLHTYVISTNAISTLNITKGSDGSGTGNFTAKANLDEHFDDGRSPVAIEGGATFQMEAYQKGCTMEVAITLFRKAGGIWFSSNWNGSKTLRQAVCATSRVFVEGGGTCSTATKTARTSAEPAAAESLEQVQVNAYPNPFFDKVTLSFGKEVSEEVVISVVDMKGTVVFQKKVAAGSYVSEVEVDMTTYRSGTYIVQTVIGSERKVTKVIKY